MQSRPEGARPEVWSQQLHSSGFMCFNALVSSTLLASSALVARGVTPSPQSSCVLLLSC